MALGVYPQVSLKEARDKRESAKKLLEQNTDPSQSKRADRRKAMPVPGFHILILCVVIELNIPLCFFQSTEDYLTSYVNDVSSGKY